MSISAEHILLTHIPPFLRHPRNLREFFFYTTGQTKHISYSCPIKRSSDDKEGDEDLDVVALVKLSNAAQCMTFIRNWTNASKAVDSTMNAFIWYDDGSMPQLYPDRSEVDRRMLESLWDAVYSDRKDDDVGRTAKSADERMVSKLILSYQNLKTTQEQLDRGETPQLSTSDSLKSELKLDKDKVAAAAGGYGAYDEDTDPLNAPDVLAAVAEFRKKVDESTGGYKRKRSEYVKNRLNELKIKAKESIIQKSKSVPAPPTTLLPPPLPQGMMPPIGVPPILISGVPPPPPVLLPPALPPVLASHVTELSQATFQADEGPVSKKTKYDDTFSRKETVEVVSSEKTLAEIRAKNEAEDYAAYLKEAKTYTMEQILSNANFLYVEDQYAPTIRAFVKEQLVEYLGEEEATLVDFIMNYINKDNKERGTNGLLDELEMVLEEDAKKFVVDLFKKMADFS